MKLSRPSRFVAALIALISVLFMQFAVASYACPGMGMGQSESVAVAASMDDQSMSACEGMDMAQPSLCHAYGQSDNLSLDKPQVPNVAPFMPIALMLAWSSVDIARTPTAAPPEPVSLGYASAPPLSIRNCCFRI